MAWVPTHQSLKEHPKTRRAARRAGVSIPTMIGHLHCLWYWALDHAPDGDVSKFDEDDIAAAAMWDDDPTVLVKALLDCGPGDSEGFLTRDHQLHDWDEYGGKYGKRREEGRKAAAKRWNKPANGDPIGTHKAANAEERRGDENPSSASGDAGDFDGWWSEYPRKVDKAEAKKAYRKALTTGPKAGRPTADDLTAGLRRSKVIWKRENRPLDKHPYAATWLNKRRWEDEVPRESRSSTGVNEAWAS